MDKIGRRNRRRKSVRKRVFGSAEKPRMCISKSNRSLSVQMIDDTEGKTLCSLSTLSSAIKGKTGAASLKNIKFAKALGEEVAKVAADKGVSKVVFDRSGHMYHGVIKAVADSAREKGLQF